MAKQALAGVEINYTHHMTKLDELIAERERLAADVAAMRKGCDGKDSDECWNPPALTPIVTEDAITGVFAVREKVFVFGRDGYMTLWDKSSCSGPLQRWQAPGGSPITSVVWQKQKNLYWTGHKSGEIYSWDLKAKFTNIGQMWPMNFDKIMWQRNLEVPPVEPNGAWLGTPVVSLAVSRPDGKILYSGGEDGWLLS